MTDEIGHQLGTTPQANKTAIQPGTDFWSVGWGSILQVLFDIARANFFRMQVRRIERQRLQTPRFG